MEKSLPTVQAALIINMLYNMQLQDKIGRTYIKQALTMARELELFTASESTKSRYGRDSRLFTRWCLYFWARQVHLDCAIRPSACELH
jgi:hypothetical protein